MGDRTNGTGPIRAFIEPYLGLLSWDTVKRRAKVDEFPLEYRQRGGKPEPFIDHEKFFAWLKTKEGK
jgi:hypothetical protein